MFGQHEASDTSPDVPCPVKTLEHPQSAFIPVTQGDYSRLYEHNSGMGYSSAGEHASLDHFQKCRACLSTSPMINLDLVFKALLCCTSDRSVSPRTSPANATCNP